MADLPSHTRNAESLSAELIAQRGFITSRRGFDPGEVRTFLGQVAAEVRSLRERISELDTARREAEERARHPKLDEETILAAVGKETADVLRSAQSAAAEIRHRAEEQATGLLRDAQAQAQAMRSEAESAHSRIIDEAEAQAEQIRNVANTDAERTRTVARQEADAIRHQADQERRLTVEAAQNVRERILSDLARRRRVATVQVDQLRAGRERLLGAYLVVRRTLDEVTDELQRADAEARAASDAIGEQLAGDQLGGAEAELLAQPLPEVPPVLEAPAVASGSSDTGPHPKTPSPPSATAVSAPDAVVTGSDASDRRAGGAGNTGELGGQPEGTAGRAPQSAPSGTPDPPVAPARPPATPPASISSRSASSTSAAPQSPPPPAPSSSVAAGSPASAGATESVRIISTAVETTPRSGRSRSARRRAAAAPVEGSPAETAEQPDDEQVEGLFDRLRAEDTGGDEPGADAASERTEDEAADEAVPDGDELLLQQRDGATSGIEVRLARRLKRALQDEQNDLLDRLRNRKGAAVAQQILPTAEAQSEGIAAAARPLLEEAARAGATFSRSLFDQALPARGASLSPPVDDLPTGLAGAIAHPLRQQLERAFAESGDADDDAELVESIGVAYREWKTQRIEQVAGDHIAVAFARGSFAVIPDGRPVRWLVEDLGGPCPDCDDNVLAGSQPKGEEFPTGQLFPPAHAGCRCVLVPGDT